jgi:hypothetical protein
MDTLQSVETEEPPPYNDQATNFRHISQPTTSQDQSSSDSEPPWTEPAHSKAMVRKLVPCPVRFDMSSGRFVEPVFA